MITITYTDGTTDEFKTTKHIFVDTENDDDWAIITENDLDSDDDDYDSDSDVTIAEIRKDQIRKIQYD